MTVKINNKTSKLTFAKSIDADKRTITAYVSTYDWDRTDERFAKGAWNLAKYKQNPVVMWGHNYGEPPIAKALSIEEDDHGLVSVMQFADTERAKEVFELYKGGFLSAFSVGFNPRKYQLEPIDAEHKGTVFTDAELLEYSAVSIPANPGALITHDLAQLATKALGDKAVIKVETDGKEPQYLVAQPEKGPEEPEEEPKGPEEPEEPEPDNGDPPEAAKRNPKDLAVSLKYVISLAENARTQKVGEPQLALLNNAVSVFQEIIDQNSEGVPAEAIQKLAGVVEEYAKVIANLFPDASLTVRRAMNQIEKSLRERGTAA